MVFLEEAISQLCPKPANPHAFLVRELEINPTKSAFGVM